METKLSLFSLSLFGVPKSNPKELICKNSFRLSASLKQLANEKDFLFNALRRFD